VTDLLPYKILSADDGPAAEVVNPNGRAAVCLVCEHASANIPASLDGLGLSEEHRLSHAAWDPGASDLAHVLSDALDAPLVLARVSRLVHDCNRAPTSGDAMPARTETIDIPGNHDVSSEEKTARVREVYDAFHKTLTDTLDGFATQPAMVTVHSFTPTWFGKPRSTEIGLLHDADARMAFAMHKSASSDFKVALNQPYSAADGVTHMLARHAIPRGLDNVMVEVRNDLLSSDAAVQSVATALHHMIEAARARVEVR